MKKFILILVALLCLSPIFSQQIVVKYDVEAIKTSALDSKVDAMIADMEGKIQTGYSVISMTPIKLGGYEKYIIVVYDDGQ